MTPQEYDLDNPPVDEWRDEQDRSEWFEEAAWYWHGMYLSMVDAFREQG